MRLESYEIPETNVFDAEIPIGFISGPRTTTGHRTRVVLHIDGKIHTDSLSKIITCISTSSQFGRARVRLRLLRSGQYLNDVLVEVPPRARHAAASKGAETPVSSVTSPSAGPPGHPVSMGSPSYGNRQSRLLLSAITLPPPHRPSGYLRGFCRLGIEGLCAQRKFFDSWEEGCPGALASLPSRNSARSC